jgi:molybdate transport system regulatory protein
MASPKPRLQLRVRFGSEHSLGMGKVQLLEAVDELGSISAAARSMNMAYRHAWELIDDLNRCFGEKVVSTASGGSRGGGAELTALGHELVARFRDMEARAREALADDLAALDRRARGGDER